jgi:hypothetical protein
MPLVVHAGAVRAVVPEVAVLDVYRVTKVVEVVAIRDRADVSLPSPDLREVLPPTLTRRDREVERPVPGRGESACPDPTRPEFFAVDRHRSVLVYLLPEPFFGEE